MLIEVLLAFFIGIVFGIFTGVFPGIHINLVAALLVAFLGAGVFAGVPIVVLVVFVVSMSITHTFIDFIPGVYLGAPDEDTALAVLPGHQLLREGRGHEAVLLTLYGGLFALIAILFLSPLFIFFLSFLFEAIKAIIPFVLIFVSLYLVFRERDFMVSLMVFILAGFLGWLSFNLPVKEPLLPLLSGLFGISGLVVSLKNKVKIPEQKVFSLKSVKMKWKEVFRYGSAGVLSAPLCSFLPGIGSGHASVIGSEILGRKQNNEGFLFLVGSINTIVMGLSFVSVYVLGKGRTGSAAVVQELLGKISFFDLFLILIVVFFSGIFAFFIGIFISKFFAKSILKVNYAKISFFVIFLVLLVNFFLSNWLGFIVLITGSAIGVFCILSGVKRIHMMGCLMLPTIIYYLV